ncbi:MAG TPA: SusC/RagA family TonB-linked outer membrane protein [Gemmatimonadaceae bacterium]|nr:SusC/RagA family TonB-linked outer membrane protein [Gemmatimonadaceae bacterium]
MKKLFRSTRFLASALAALAFVAPALAQGQGAVISGRVMSEQGQPIVGANVYINDLNISVGTSQSGNFTITIPQARLTGASVNLRVRAIGYQPQMKVVTLNAGSQTANFDLRRDVTQLGEVVVTGVSTATETVKLPFTVAHLDTAQMPVSGSNPVTQLQGKVPGALIVNASGRPGAAPSVVLRGPVSLNATGRSQQPLYLLDGVPLQGGLPDINPQDIENVEVVKGAAAAALYGARAGSGVINITTKTGKNAPQGIRFGVRTEAGAGDIEGKFPLAQRTLLTLAPSTSLFCSNELVGGSTCGRYIDWDTEVQRINNSGEDFTLPPQSFLRDYFISGAPTYENLTGYFQVNQWPVQRDPIAQAVTPSAYANTNVDMRGKVNQTGVYASIGNFTQQGAVTYLSGFVRNSARVNVDQRFGDRISANINTFYSQSVDHAANFDETSGTAGTWFNLTRAPFISDLTARDALGRIVYRSNPLRQGDANFNPLYSTAYYNRADRNTRFVGGISGRYTPIDWLNLDASFGYDRSMSTVNQVRDRGWRASSANPVSSSGFAAEGSFDSEQYTTQMSAAANKTFFGDLNATLTTKYTYGDQTLRNTGASGTGLVVAGLDQVDATTANFTNGSNSTFPGSPALQQVRDMGFFVGTDLDWKDRYILSALVRRDGSSLFGAGNRWQTFGRLAGAWIVSREPFWPADNAISLFKLRASQGTTGQRPRFNAQYETFTIGTGGTLNPSFLGNKNLKPELNKELELGTDLEFFHRVGVNISYAKAVIDRQILPVKAPTASGFQSQWLNAGEITNKTWEGTLNVPIITGKSFTWSSRLIYDQTRSVITRLDVPEFVGTITPGPTNTFDIFKFRQGEKIGTIYGFDYVKSCAQLPTAFQSQCSGSSSDLNAAYRPNADGYIVWVGQGNSLTEGITKNLWRAQTGLGNGPWGNNTNWGMPITLRDSVSNIAFVPVGSGLPKYHWGLSHNVDFGRFNVFGLLDAYQGQKLWNIAYHWSQGDFQAANEDQAGKSVEDARPLGYYWRRGGSTSPGGNAGVGGLYDALNPSTFSVEDASYIKLRELTVNYRLGSIAGTGDWKVGLVGRNLKTWTDYRGFDPESGNTTGPLNSSALTPVAGYRFPNLRTYTLQISTSF